MMKRWIVIPAFVGTCIALPATEAAAAATSRPVVIEEFSGVWCLFCYGPGMALDRIESEFSRDEILVLSYHESDEFTIPFCTSRRTYYGGSASPIGWFNGGNSQTGGSTFAEGPAGVQLVYNAYMQKIQTEQQRTSTTIPFQLRVTGRVGPNDPELTLYVSTTTGYPRGVTAHFLIAENGVPVMDPPNGKTIVNALARAHLGARTVTLASAGSARLTVSYTGTIPFNAAANLRPIVFLQDDTNKEIVGAVGVLSGPAASTRWSLYR